MGTRCGVIERAVSSVDARTSSWVGRGEDMRATIRVLRGAVDAPYSRRVIDERFALTPGSSERELFTTFLEFQRKALIRKCAGLTDEQLRSRPIASTLSLVGLVRHLATVERWYFQAVIDGHFPGSLFDHASDEAFAAVDAATGEAAFATWSHEVNASRRIAAEHELDAIGSIPPDGPSLTLRWVLVHMIDEYARHLGHADLLREAIDGATGE